MRSASCQTVAQIRPRRHACAQTRYRARHFAQRSPCHPVQAVWQHLGEDTTRPVHLLVHRQHQAHVAARRGQRPRERSADVSEVSGLDERSDLGRSKQDIRVGVGAQLARAGGCAKMGLQGNVLNHNLL